MENIQKWGAVLAHMFEDIFGSTKKTLILFAIIGFVIYGIMLTGELLWDDKSLVIENKFIKSFSYWIEWFTTSAAAGSGGVSNVYRPLATMINTVLYHLFGLSPAAFHTFNILLHILNTYLVFVLFKQLRFAQLGAGLAALIFLVHPVQAESVSYVAGLPDVLSACFILLGLIIFTKNNNSITHFGLIIMVTILALLSKESGVVLFPLSVLALLYLNFAHRIRVRTSHYINLTLIGTLTIVYIALKMTVFNFTGTGGLNPFESTYTQNLDIRIYTFFAAIFEYVRLIFFPAILNFERTFLAYANPAGKSMVGLLILIASIGGIIYALYKRQVIYAFSVLWFLIALFPVSGIIIPVNSVYYEHWLYIPLIGILALIPFFYEKYDMERSRNTLIFICVILIIAGGVRTVARNYQWIDPHRFYEYELSMTQKSGRLFNQAGQLYFDEKQYDIAEGYFKKGIEMDTDVRLPELRYNLASSYLAQKELEPAIDMYFQALETKPQMREPLVALYNIALAVHDEERAEKFRLLVDRTDAGEKVTFEEIKSLSY